MISPSICDSMGFLSFVSIVAFCSVSVFVLASYFIVPLTPGATAERSLAFSAVTFSPPIERSPSDCAIILAGIKNMVANITNEAVLAFLSKLIFIVIRTSLLKLLQSNTVSEVWAFDVTIRF